MAFWGLFFLFFLLFPSLFFSPFPFLLFALLPLVYTEYTGSKDHRTQRLRGMASGGMALRLEYMDCTDYMDYTNSKYGVEWVYTNIFLPAGEMMCGLMNRQQSKVANSEGVDKYRYIQPRCGVGKMQAVITARSV